MYGDPAGSRSDARAASLISGATAVSESGVSMRGLEHRPFLVVRLVSADAGLARPTVAGDSVREAHTAGNPKASDSMSVREGVRGDVICLMTAPEKCPLFPATSSHHTALKVDRRTTRLSLISHSPDRLLAAAAAAQQLVGLRLMPPSCM
eukprot:scaffold113651_cov60-Phaeocystis_antarctica.AAC.1